MRQIAFLVSKGGIASLEICAESIQHSVLEEPHTFKLDFVTNYIIFSTF